MVTITNAVLYYKGEDKTESITPEAFISDLEFYSESGIFADSIDFRYFRTGKEKLIIQAGNMSRHRLIDLLYHYPLALFLIAF